MRWCSLFSLLAIGILWLVAADRARAADFPKGTFNLKDKEGAVWAVTFDGKGKFTVTRDDKEGLTGKYKVAKDEIEFTDDEGPFAGKGDDQMATYKWKLDGKKLTFTKVKDSSAGREAVVTGGPWEKKE